MKASFKELSDKEPPSSWDVWLIFVITSHPLICPFLQQLENNDLYARNHSFMELIFDDSSCSLSCLISRDFKFVKILQIYESINFKKKIM